VKTKWCLFFIIGLLVLLLTPLIGCGESYSQEDINRANQEGYDTGFTAGLASTPQDVNAAYRDGYNAGLVDGLAEGKSVEQEAYDRGYKAGYNDGLGYAPEQAYQQHFEQGNIYLEQEELYRAIYEYTQAIELNPEFAEAYAQRALAILLEQEYNRTMDCGSKAAIHDAEKALALNPSIDLDRRLARAYDFQGDCYHFNMDYEESIIYYTKALELDPNIGCRRPIDVYWELIYDSLTYHEYDKAIEYCNKAIELNTGDNDYYYRQLAEAYHGRGGEHSHENRDKAIADYTRAIELDPTNAKYYLSRAGIYETLADMYRDHGEVSKEVDSYNKAIADYTKAIELDPEAAWGYFGRGQCYAGNEDYHKAIKDYTRAIELGEHGWSVYWWRAYAYENLGDKDKALSDYRKVLELSEDEWIKETILGKVEELESD